MQSSEPTPFGQPPDRVIELGRGPSVAAFLWVLLPLGLFALSVPFALFLLAGPALGLALGGGFFASLVSVGVVFFVVARRRPVEHRLILGPRGVFLADRSGAVVGRLGAPPLVLTPGHWLSGSRSGTRQNQCVLVGGTLSIGTYGAFSPYRASVPTLGRPRYPIPAEKWAELVQALPELRALQ